MHSGATPLLRGCSRKNIFCQKIFDNFFSFQATEMVLTSKWGRIQQEIQIWPDQVVAGSWTVVGSPKHAEKMLIQLRSPTAPSWPAVHWSTQSNTVLSLVGSWCAWPGPSSARTGCWCWTRPRLQWTWRLMTSSRPRSGRSSGSARWDSRQHRRNGGGKRAKSMRKW